MLLFTEEPICIIVRGWNGIGITHSFLPGICSTSEKILYRRRGKCVRFKPYSSGQMSARRIQNKTEILSKLAGITLTASLGLGVRFKLHSFEMSAGMERTSPQSVPLFNAKELSTF